MDRHIKQAIDASLLSKLSGGLYLFTNGNLKNKANENELIKCFLKDARFLLIKDEDIFKRDVLFKERNVLSLPVVINHKRHGKFKLANTEYDFRVKHHFPEKITEEYVVVFCLNDELERNSRNNDEAMKSEILRLRKSRSKLDDMISDFGSEATKKYYTNIVIKA